MAEPHRRFKFPMLGWVLIPLGLIAAIVLVAPSLVVIGFIFLIIPGLILAAIPTVFSYLLGTALFRLALPIRSEVASHLIAIALTFGLSAAVMAPWRTIEQQEFAQATLPDIAPAAQLAIDGDILLEWPLAKFSSGKEVYCDYLCTALLDTPGVTSVTRICEQGSATFRRGVNNPGSLVTPVEPEQVLATFSKLNGDRKFLKFDAKLEADRALGADWALRFAQGDEIRRDVAIGRDQVDWTIKYESLPGKVQPRVERLEISDRQGNVIARKSLVRHFVPSLLFYFGFEGGSSADGFSGAKFTVGGSTVSNQPNYYDLDGPVELLRVVSIPEPVPQPNVIAQTELALLKVLNDPQATESELLVAPMWLQQFKYNAGPDQLETIERILLDERIADPAELLEKALASQTNLTPLRAGLVKRFLTATETKSKSWYISCLVGLADLTFKRPTADERVIWCQALTVHEAAPFVERIADQGVDSVPQLMELLEESIKQPRHARWRVLRGVREAFKRMGPAAASAAPRIQSLIEDSPSSLLNSADDRLTWMVALTLMGVDEDQLPYRTQEPHQIASESKRVRQQAERYLKDRR